MNFRVNEIGLGKTTKHACAKDVHFSLKYPFILVFVKRKTVY
jgi:hypothetical protein